ncbi:RidA family protein [Clostridium sp. AM58-1XD]|uniref:RidA family protein n=1 Tax=Clostridium sp. AM58-1XD TaxID=2292307 RepID=UPI000E48ACD3|nr:RidA family protein [Clostridium sp. AM58-1XD]RGY97720.1 RidA family protein [Clostridium sp. AM58-1XD]
MSYEERLEEIGYRLPELPAVSKKPFEAGVKTGNLIFVSGNAARVNGVLKYTGTVGDGVTIQEAQEAAKIAFVNCLAAVRRMEGSLESIERIVNIKGYVASTPDFTGQPAVMDEVSKLAVEVFKDAGKHSRVALGASSLPGGTPVEVELVVQVK